jgi:hypothetical protein
MTDTRKWNELSEDELAYRQLLQETMHVEPTQRAVEILDERISKVLLRLGVDPTKNRESIDMQMDLLGISINSLSEEQTKKGAGLYVTATIGGELVPYAYISAAKLADGRYTFPIIYWQNGEMDEGVPERI